MRSHKTTGLALTFLAAIALIAGCVRKIDTAPSSVTVVTATPTGTITPVMTNTFTSTNTLVATNTFTLTKTNTPVFTNTFTNTYTKTFTPIPTNTFTPTNTGANTATYTFTPSSTATFTPTNTGANTATFTFTPTSTATFTNTIPGATNTFTNTFTSSPTPTATSCTPAAFQSVYTFDTSLDCWSIDSGSVAKVTSYGLSTTTKHTGAGSLTAAINATAGTSAQFNEVFASGQDLTGRTLQAWVYVDPSMAGASIQAYILSPSWGAGGWTNFTVGNGNLGKWVLISYTLPAGVTSVTQLGFQFYNLTAGTTGNVYIDDVKLVAGLCTAATVQPTYTFDSSLDCWHIDSGSAGVVPDWGVTASTSPAPHGGTGVMYASVVEGGTSTNVQFDLNFTPTQDLTGKTLSAWVWVDPALAGAAGQLFMQAGPSSYTWVNNVTATTFDVAHCGSWQQLTFTPAWGTTDSTNVALLGIQFYGAPTSTSGMIYVDDVTITGGAPTDTPTITPTYTDTYTPVPGATDTFTFTPTPTGVAATPTPCQGAFQTAYSFDTSMECWAMDSSSAPAVTAWNIVSSPVTEGTGAMHIGFTEPSTSANIQIEETYATAADLSGRTVTAWFYADPSMQGGGVQFFLQSGGWSWSNSTGVYLDATKVGKWVSVSWFIAGTDPTAVDQIGLQFYSIPANATGNLYVDNINFSAQATPTNTPVPGCTPTLLNNCETLTENGTWSGTNSLFSITTTGATLGSNALDVNIATPPAGGWNDQFIQLSGFTPNTWANGTVLTMDMTVDASVLVGTTYNQMYLEGSTGGGPWTYMSSNHPSLSAGLNHVSFTLDWTQGLNATDPLDQLVIVLQTGGTSGTGNVYLDNVQVNNCP